MRRCAKSAPRARGHEGVEGRAGRQLSQDEKAQRADHVIRNDGTLSDLEAAVRGGARRASR